jgi:hypothetical protein
MDYLDSKFADWLDQVDKEAERVKRMADYRQRQASELLNNVNRARIFVNRARSAPETDFSEIEALMEKIKELRAKIGQ